MSLGVDDRSPSTAEASEMMEGWREWHGLTRTAATKTGQEGKENMLVFFGVCLGTKRNEQGKLVSSQERHKTLK